MLTLRKYSSDDKRDMEKWDRSNRMSFIIMKRAISEAFRDTMSEMVTRAKVLKKVEKRFARTKRVKQIRFWKTLS